MKVSIRSDLSFAVKNDLNFSVQICTYCGVRYSIEIAEWELSLKRSQKYFVKKKPSVFRTGELSNSQSTSNFSFLTRFTPKLSYILINVVNRKALKIKF